LACCFQQGYAQQQQQTIFSNITLRNGLASNHVTGMVQDERVYLWIGTINGLQRYDGSRFTSVHQNPFDNKSIPGNHIAFLYLDRKKRLWVNFDDGRMGICSKGIFAGVIY